MSLFKRIVIFGFLGLFSFSISHAQPVDSILARLDVQNFINEMVLKYQFNAIALNELFAKVSLRKAVIRKYKHPYEKNLWNIYKKHFISNGRTELGVAFWKKQEQTLKKAQKIYGVPPEIIVAIIGVETKYGLQLGNYRVIDSLSTLAFQNTTRADFFRMELSQFLIYCRDNDIKPLRVYGSYAGAFGIPQFMPSSVITYAVSSKKNGKINLMHNADDAILSVANFLNAHGWKKGRPIATRARVRSPYRTQRIKLSFQRPTLTTSKLNHFGLAPRYHIDPKTHFGIYVLDLKNHKHQYWLGFGNYYVIRTYNQSFQYAMAVYTLSRDLKNARYKKTNYKK